MRIRKEKTLFVQSFTKLKMGYLTNFHILSVLFWNLHPLLRLRVYSLKSDKILIPWEWQWCLIPQGGKLAPHTAVLRRWNPHLYPFSKIGGLESAGWVLLSEETGAFPWWGSRKGSFAGRCRQNPRNDRFRQRRKSVPQRTTKCVSVAPSKDALWIIDYHCFTPWTYL